MKINQMLARPTGSRLLIQVKFDHIQRKTKGGIVLAESTIDAEERGSQVATIVALGPLAFDHYPTDEPTPRVGDWISTNRYPGYQVGAGPISDNDRRLQELRVITDDEVMAVFPPESLEFDEEDAA